MTTNTVVALKYEGREELKGIAGYIIDYDKNMVHIRSGDKLLPLLTAIPIKIRYCKDEQVYIADFQSDTDTIRVIGDLNDITEHLTRHGLLHGPRENLNDLLMIQLRRMK